MPKILNQLKKDLLEHKRSPVNAPDVYKTGDLVLWVRVPEIRKLSKKYLTFFLEQKNPFKDLKSIWDARNSHDLGYFVLITVEYLYEKKKYEDKKFYRFLCHAQKSLDNWAHSDQAAKVLTRLYEKDYSLYESDLLKWSKSKNLWLRRQSAVALFYYQVSKNAHPKYKVAEQIYQIILEDEEYYVQKGLGWSLRECFQVYPKQTLRFLDKNLYKLTSTAFSTAIEKQEKTLKERLKSARKIYRQKNK